MFDPLFLWRQHLIFLLIILHRIHSQDKPNNCQQGKEADLKYHRFVSQPTHRIAHRHYKQSFSNHIADDKGSVIVRVKGKSIVHHPRQAKPINS